MAAVSAGRDGVAELGVAAMRMAFIFVVGAPGNARMHPTVRVEAIVVQADAARIGALADAAAVRLMIPIDRMVPLAAV
jgi:hypothetical protein